jgi:hypothetical protein
MEETERPKWYAYHRTEGTRLAGPWVLTWIFSAVILGTLDLSLEVRAVVGLIPLPAFGWFLWRYVRHIRALDELHQRIELEALAIAFPLSVALLMTMGQLQVARQGTAGFPITNWFWTYLVLFYLLGRVIASRRYR